ncbi:heterokaryon incompatibility, partial [Mytilinidion resinicola]
EDTNYVALSHYWGNTHTFITTSTNLAKTYEGIPWLELPKTFQDAVIINRRLGIRYLWIDSLCILQDSESDWHFESARMGEIYTNSYITSAASLAPNGGTGIFHSRSGETYKFENGVTVKLSLASSHLDPPRPLTLYSHAHGLFKSGSYKLMCYRTAQKS